ncbi:vitamin B12 transporter [Sphingobium faniae]|nr:vitamin B12 transporter [Sphingobium faniae]
MSLYHISLLSLPLLFACAPMSAHAAAAADVRPDDELVVTAFRTPVEWDKVASSVTVLDQQAIEQAQPLAITDILVRTPGISLSRNGGYGTATSVRIRGADAGQSVMVIDGMRISDPSSTAGGYGFANLFADDISRIEILRGPQSILWGSDAIGGVVNVQTVRPTRALEGSFAFEGGSRDTINARAAMGGTSPLIDWRVAGSAFSTDGVSARSNGTEGDGYRRRAASGNATIKLSSEISVDLRGYWAKGRNDFDGFAGDTTEYGRTEEWTLYAGFNALLLDGRFANRLAILQSDTQRRNFDPARTVRPINFDAHGRVRRYEYQGTLTLSDMAQIVFGAERDEQRMTTASPNDSAAPYLLTPHRTDTDSLYGEMRLTPVKGVTLSGGVRRDHNSRFGNNTAFSGGAVWSIEEGNTVLRASYDEGFKAPSLYQLFSDYGSAGLRPEKAKGWEIGFEQAVGQLLRLSATWFDRDTDNLIDFAYCPTSGALPSECYIPGTTTERFGYYANVKQSHARGLELSGSLEWRGLFADANYSWIKAEDRTSGRNYGRQLARVPRHMANGELGYRFPFGLKASVAVRYAGEIYDRATGTARLDDYWLTDLRADWQVRPGLSLYGRVENLSDTHYETASGYGTLGRSFHAGIRSRF